MQPPPLTAEGPVHSRAVGDRASADPQAGLGRQSTGTYLQTSPLFFSFFLLLSIIAFLSANQ